jgi:hypothetical protein
MKTITCWIIVLGVTIFAYLIAFVWMFYKTIAKWIRKNDELVADDWEETDKHPWNYSLCHCKECKDKNHKELFGDTESTTEINHNLRNNR